MANREFKVGDKLRIREWDDMKSEFGLNSSGNISCRFTFTQEMKRLCGENFTVRKIGGDHFYSEEAKFGDYHISADMLEYRKDRDYNIATDDKLQMLFAADDECSAEQDF